MENFAREKNRIVYGRNVFRDGLDFRAFILYLTLDFYTLFLQDDLLNYH